MSVESLTPGWLRCLFRGGLLCSMLAFCASQATAAERQAAGADTNSGLPGAPFRAPYVPASVDEVLQEVPSIADPAVAQMLALRKALDATPQSLPAAEQLADAYIDYSRQIGDAHFAGYAEAVISPWLHTAAPPAPALVIQAVILQYRHQFDEARALLLAALKRDGRNSQAWLTLATLDTVQGNYELATKDCAQVSNSAGAEIGLACFASLRSYTGQAQQSMVVLHQVETTTEKLPPSFRAWIQGLLAESAERLGDWPQVEMHFRQALALQPEDNFLLVAYADFLLDRSRPQEVLTLLASHSQSDTAFLRLALAQQALRSDQVQRYSWIMAARFEALRLRGSDYFGREESRFALQLQHDPKTALEMGLRNWAIQRAPEDARVLLEAALAAKQPQAVEPALDFLEKTKLQDPLLEPLIRQVRGQLSSAGTP